MRLEVDVICKEINSTDQFVKVVTDIAEHLMVQHGEAGGTEWEIIRVSQVRPPRILSRRAAGFEAIGPDGRVIQT